MPYFAVPHGAPGFVPFSNHSPMNPMQPLGGPLAPSSLTSTPFGTPHYANSLPSFGNSTHQPLSRPTTAPLLPYRGHGGHDVPVAPPLRSASVYSSMTPGTSRSLDTQDWQVSNAPPLGFGLGLSFGSYGVLS